MLVKDDNLKVLSFYLSLCFVSRHYSPLCVVEQDEHAGAAIILETLIVMPVCVPNEIIKYGRVNNVQQPRPCIIWRHFLHRVAVTLVVLPPACLTQIHWNHHVYWCNLPMQYFWHLHCIITTFSLHSAEKAGTLMIWSQAISSTIWYHKQDPNTPLRTLVEYTTILGPWLTKFFKFLHKLKFLHAELQLNFCKRKIWRR